MWLRCSPQIALPCRYGQEALSAGRDGAGLSGALCVYQPPDPHVQGREHVRALWLTSCNSTPLTNQCSLTPCRRHKAGSSRASNSVGRKPGGKKALAGVSEVDLDRTGCVVARVLGRSDEYMRWRIPPCGTANSKKLVWNRYQRRWHTPRCWLPYCVNVDCRDVTRVYRF